MLADRVRMGISSGGNFVNINIYISGDIPTNNDVIVLFPTMQPLEPIAVGFPYDSSELNAKYHEFVDMYIDMKPYMINNPLSISMAQTKYLLVSKTSIYVINSINKNGKSYTPQIIYGADIYNRTQVFYVLFDEPLKNDDVIEIIIERD